jgi:gliding motility-associated-like protein
LKENVKPLIKPNFMRILLFLLSTVLSFQLYSQCDGSEPQFDFGPDTILCPGQTLQLSIPPGYNYYDWSTGAFGVSITVNSPGMYSVVTGVTGPNLIINGDFEAGTTAAANNFTTAYAPGSGGTYGLLSLEGQYAITTSPNLAHVNFVTCQDHTPTGPGNMLIANGSSAANTNVWSQTVTTQTNVDYIFRFWVTNVVNDPNLAQLQLYINGNPISVVTPTASTPCQWIPITGIWNSGTATTANLSIINQSTAIGGNDFAVDDIFFATNCEKQDSIMVSYDVVTVNGGSDITFCQNESDTLVATTNNPANLVEWTFAGTPGNTFVPTVSGNYQVTATSPFGCTVSDYVQVIVKPINWEVADVLVGLANCGQNNGYVSAIMDTVDPSLPYPAGLQYTWNGPGAGNPNSINASVFQNLSPGWYYLSVSSNGCTIYDSAEVTVANAPTAAFTANPTSGYGPLSVDFQNNSTGGNNHVWVFDTLGTQSTANPDPVNFTFTDPGTYTVMLITYNGNCTDTAYQTIIVLPPPPIPPIVPMTLGEIPNVFSPNGDLVNDLFTFEVTNPKEFEVVILNRWGIVLYQTTDAATFLWNGKSQLGDEAEEGVYFYRFRALSYQDEEIAGHGFLHLIR